MSLTREDLQAISEIVDQQVGHQLGIMMEQYFDPRFNALADAIKDIHEHKVNRDELRGKLEIFKTRQDVQEVILKRHEREIEELKKAQ